ncbi:MAG TPA: hypothetical protein VNF07_04095 [Acidimicrobiales bacterium]|nr:hypothetical protein [Acidimicrobiales bacterium]
MADSLNGTSLPIPAFGTDSELDEEVDADLLAMVQAVAGRLDRVKRALADLGSAVLLAELRQQTELICGALDELAEFSEQTVRALRV